MSQEKTYAVENLLEVRKNGRSFEFLVKWEGYVETTWEDESSLIGPWCLERAEVLKKEWTKAAKMDADGGETADFETKERTAEDSITGNVFLEKAAENLVGCSKAQVPRSTETTTVDTKSGRDIFKKTAKNLVGCSKTRDAHSTETDTKTGHGIFKEKKTTSSTTEPRRRSTRDDGSPEKKHSESDDDGIPEIDTEFDMDASGLPKAAILEDVDWTVTMKKEATEDAPAFKLSHSETVRAIQRVDIETLRKTLSSCPSGAAKNLMFKEEATGKNVIHMLCVNHVYAADMVRLILKSIGTVKRLLLLYQKDGEGQNPLHYAVSQGLRHLVGAMVRYGAPLEEENQEKLKALDIAYANRDSEMALDLLMAGANFEELLAKERRKPSSQNKRVFLVLRDHSEHLRKLLFQTRKGAYEGLEEVEAISPMFSIAPGTAKATFKFEFEPYAIQSGEYTYMTFFFICDLGKDFSKSTARCSGDLHFKDGFPSFNGEAMKKVQESRTPMVFYCCPEEKNTIDVVLTEGHPLVVAIQVVLVKLSDETAPKKRP